MTDHSSIESVFDEIRTAERATTTKFVVDHSSKGFGSHGMVVVEVVFKLPLLFFGHFLTSSTWFQMFYKTHFRSIYQDTV